MCNWLETKGLSAVFTEENIFGQVKTSRRDVDEPIRMTRVNYVRC